MRSDHPEGSVSRVGWTTPRFRIRTLMILVLVVAVMLGTVAHWVAEIPARCQRFYIVAYEHDQVSGGLYFGMAGTSDSSEAAIAGAEQLSPERRAWHHAMVEKYLYAMKRPWLPVLPDPPMPP